MQYSYLSKNMSCPYCGKRVWGKIQNFDETQRQVKRIGFTEGIKNSFTYGWRIICDSSYDEESDEYCKRAV